MSKVENLDKIIGQLFNGKMENIIEILKILLNKFFLVTGEEIEFWKNVEQIKNQRNFDQAEFEELENEFIEEEFISGRFGDGNSLFQLKPAAEFLWIAILRNFSSLNQFVYNFLISTIENSMKNTQENVIESRIPIYHGISLSSNEFSPFLDFTNFFTNFLILDLNNAKNAIEKKLMEKTICKMIGDGWFYYIHSNPSILFQYLFKFHEENNLIISIWSFIAFLSMIQIETPIKNEIKSIIQANIENILEKLFFILEKISKKNQVIIRIFLNIFHTLFELLNDNHLIIHSILSKLFLYFSFSLENCKKDKNLSLLNLIHCLFNELVKIECVQQTILSNGQSNALSVPPSQQIQNYRDFICKFLLDSSEYSQQHSDLIIFNENLLLWFHCFYFNLLPPCSVSSSSSNSSSASLLSRFHQILLFISKFAEFNHLNLHLILHLFSFHSISDFPDFYFAFSQPIAPILINLFSSSSPSFQKVQFPHFFMFHYHFTHLKSNKIEIRITFDSQYL